MKVLRPSEAQAAARQALVEKMVKIVAEIRMQAGRSPNDEVYGQDIAEYAALHSEQVSAAELVAIIIMAWSSRYPTLLEVDAAVLKPAIDGLVTEMRQLARGVQIGTMAGILGEIETIEAVCPHCNGPIDFAGIREVFMTRIGILRAAGGNNGSRSE